MTESAFPLVQTDTYDTGQSSLPEFPGVVGAQLASVPEPTDFVTADHCALQSAHTHGPVVIPDLTIVIDPVGLTVLKADHSPVAVLPWTKLSRLEVIGRADLPPYGQAVVLVADTSAGKTHTFVVPVADPAAFHRKVQDLAPKSGPRTVAMVPAAYAPTTGMVPSAYAPITGMVPAEYAPITSPSPLGARLAGASVAPGTILCLVVAFGLAIAMAIITF